MRRVIASKDRSTRRLACLTLAAASGLHLAVFPSHLEEGTVVGSFFLAVAAMQLGAAGLVGAGASRRTLLGVAFANAAVLAVWAVSRTVGLPVGPRDVEPVSVLDALSAVAEVAAVLSTVVLARRDAVGEPVLTAARRGSRSVSVGTGLTASVVATVALFTGAGLAYADAHPEDHAEHHVAVNGGHYESVTSHAGHTCDLFHPCTPAPPG